MQRSQNCALLVLSKPLNWCLQNWEPHSEIFLKCKNATVGTHLCLTRLSNHKEYQDSLLIKVTPWWHRCCRRKEIERSEETRDGLDFPFGEKVCGRAGARGGRSE